MHSRSPSRTPFIVLPFLTIVVLCLTLVAMARRREPSSLFPSRVDSEISRLANIPWLSKQGRAEARARKIAEERRVAQGEACVLLHEELTRIREEEAALESLREGGEAARPGMRDVPPHPRPVLESFFQGPSRVSCLMSQAEKAVAMQLKAQRDEYIHKVCELRGGEVPDVLPRHKRDKKSPMTSRRIREACSML
eukprot:753036-Hanusia_phi.AAC.5